MKSKKLPQLNLFYKGCLFILGILTIVRYAFPSVAQGAGVHVDEGDKTYVVQVTDDGRSLRTDFLSQEAGDPDRVELTGDDDFTYDDSIGDDDFWEDGSADEGIPTNDSPSSVPVFESLSTVKATPSDLALLPLPEPTTFALEKHKIYSVPGGYLDNFPDAQDVQLPSAIHWGITPLKDRSDLERRMNQLVYVGCNPYIHLDERMSRSVPYLVPRASDLLEHLGRAFMDSLYAKRIPLHKFVVSSVLRTESDVLKLSRNNVNATERSCHLFGTTFDISYNRYYTVSPPNGPARREVRNDSLKMILSEVLRDARLEGRCYVRYEKLQPCFHITVR